MKREKEISLFDFDECDFPETLHELLEVVQAAIAESPDGRNTRVTSYAEEGTMHVGAYYKRMETDEEAAARMRSDEERAARRRRNEVESLLELAAKYPDVVEVKTRS